MPLTIEQFTQRLTSSGVMSADELRDWFAAVPVEKRPGDGEALARELVKQKRLTKFQAEQIYAGKEKSLTLGNYVILDKLGQGGMGMVLKAKHKRMERVVALKVMSPAAVKSKDAVKRFHREVQTAAKLTHPNIVTAFDADEAKGTHFLVMEYVAGDDLSQLVKKHGPLSAEQAIECVIQAARGLAHAHAEGVIHRDIKPANLLLDKHGTVKILDMGLARLESGLSDAAGVSAASLTQSGTIMGTVDYMSPEQAEDTRHADARADIYSLGCSLYYLLTGRVVYVGETMMKKLLAHRESPLPSLTLANGGRQPPGPDIDNNANRDTYIPGGLRPPFAELEAVFHRMIAKRPGDRYQSMAEVIADLERCRSGEGVTVSVNAVSGESGSNYELQKFLRQISGEEGSQITSAGTLATSTTPVDPTAETIFTANNSAGTDPQTEMTLAGERTRRVGGAKATTRNVLLASVGLVLLLLGGWWMFRTPTGTVRIEITDEQIAVTLGETGRTLHGKMDESVRLPIGEHVLHVRVGETQLDTPEITVAKREPVEIKVEKVGNRVRVMRDGKFLVAKELPRSKAAGVKKTENAVTPSDAAQNFALEFDGKASYVEIPLLGSSEFGPMTVEAWVNATALDLEAKPIVVMAGPYRIQLNRDRNGWYALDRDQGMFHKEATPTGRWFHLAVVVDEKTGLFFVDGHKVAGGPRADSTVKHALAPFACIGADKFPTLARAGHVFQGMIDEVRVSRTARYDKDFTPDVRFTSDKDTLALYHFDEGTGSELKDSSGNNHHGKIVGAKWVRIGQEPKPVALAPDFALDLSTRSAARAYVELPRQVNVSKPLTVEMWATPRSVAGKTEGRQLWTLAGLLELKQYGEHWSWQRNDNSSGQLQMRLVGTTQPLVPSRRVHLAAVSTGTELRLFVDGERIGRTDLPAPLPDLLPPHSLGGGAKESAGYGSFDGSIDEIRISQAARYDQNFAPPPRLVPDRDTLILYHCDEGSGDVLKDSSGNNHHGKIVGAKWVRANVGLPAPAPRGDFAVDLSSTVDGQYARVLLPELMFPAAGTLTLEMVVTPADAGVLRENRGLVNIGTSALALKQFGRRWVIAARKGQATEFNEIASGSDIVPGEPVHLAAVTDGKEVRLFVDGKLVSRTPFLDPFPAGLQRVQLGGGKAGVSGWGVFQGPIDEVRISKSARYDRDYTPVVRLQTDADTLVLYHFDEGQGDQAKDSSGNDNHGQLVGAKWAKVDGPAVEPGRELAVTKITPHEKFPVLKGHEGPNRRIRFLPDGKQFVSVAWDGTARLWNVETGEQVRTFPSAGADKTLNYLAVSPDGKRLAVGGSSFRVYLFDIASGKLERFIQFKDHPSMGGIEFSADGQSLFVGDVARVLHEFRVADGSPLPTQKLFEPQTATAVPPTQTSFDKRISAIVAFPDNERLLIAAYGEKEFVLWHRTKKEVVKRFVWTEPYQSLRSLALFADGQRVASAHDNNLVRIWSLETGAELKRWTAHPGKGIAATEVFPLHNDRWLLTIGDDKAIRLWDGNTFEKLDEATTEMLGTGQGAVSPDGRTLVTGAGWRLTTQSEYDQHHDLHVWRLPVPLPLD